MITSFLALSFPTLEIEGLPCRWWSRGTDPWLVLHEDTATEKVLIGRMTPCDGFTLREVTRADIVFCTEDGPTADRLARWMRRERGEPYAYSPGKAAELLIEANRLEALRIAELETIPERTPAGAPARQTRPDNRPDTHLDPTDYR